MDAIIQWYPGHIAKLERELQQILKQLDVVIEVLDARIPYATWNKGLSQKLRKQKPVFLILNKSDLADPTWTKAWVKHYQEVYPMVTSFDSSSGKGKASIVSALMELGEGKQQQLIAKGLKRRPIRTGIVGMPNVGKSSLVNVLVGAKKAKTGHRAGVTRAPQWIRIHPNIELLDTPGLIPSKLESQEMGQRLACVYSVGDAAFDEEAIIPFFINNVETYYPGTLQKAFDLGDNPEVNLETIAKRRNAILPGGVLDLKRTAQAVHKDFRHGKLGRITLEHPSS